MVGKEHLTHLVEDEVSKPVLVRSGRRRRSMAAVGLQTPWGWDQRRFRRSISATAKRPILHHHFVAPAKTRESRIEEGGELKKEMSMSPFESYVGYEGVLHPHRLSKPTYLCPIGAEDAQRESVVERCCMSRVWLAVQCSAVGTVRWRACRVCVFIEVLPGSL